MVKIQSFVLLKIVFRIIMEVMIKMTIKPPDYILAIALENEVPEIVGSCDKEDLDDLKELKEKGMHIYKLIGV